MMRMEKYFLNTTSTVLQKAKWKKLFSRRKPHKFFLDRLFKNIEQNKRLRRLLQSMKVKK